MADDTNSMPIDEYSLLKFFSIEDKQVEDIFIYNKDSSIYADITLMRQSHTCPLCKTSTDQIKGYQLKKITHSILTNTPVTIKYKARRYICPVCKKTFYEANPFVHDNMKISAITVYNVLRDLKQSTETFTSVAKRYYISKTTAASVFDKHVSIPRRKLPRYLCIDEVYAFSSEKSDYVCVLLDYESQNIVDLLPSRRKDELIDYFSYIPREERLAVEVVSSDMWKTYLTVTRLLFPNARFAVDRFHVLQELTRKVDSIRVKLMNKIKKDINKDKKKLNLEELVDYEQKDRQYYLLKKFNWLLFKNDSSLFDSNKEKLYNHKFKRYLNYDDILTMILEIDEDLHVAYELKNDVYKFYKTSNLENAPERINELIEELNLSNIKEMMEFAKTIKEWKGGIINSFIVVDDKKGSKINNGIIENRNKTIKNIKHNSNGYQNWRRFRNRVMYVLNKDTTFSYKPNEEDR